MPESRHAGAGVTALGPGESRPRAEPLPHVGGRPRRIADLAQHRQDVLVGAPVLGTLERRDRRHDRRVQIRQRGHGDAERERRGVELVIGVQRQHEIEHARDLGRGIAAVQHGQEPGGV